MKPLEEIPRPCSRKVYLRLSNIGKPNNNINKNNSLYDCMQCSGAPESCPNYTDYYALIEKYRSRR